jgi:hypothetical protein
MELLSAGISSVGDLRPVRRRASKKSFIQSYIRWEASSNSSIHNTCDLGKKPNLLSSTMDCLSRTEAAFKGPVRDFNITLGLWVVSPSIDNLYIASTAK